jgi:hypothetical protein
MGRMDIIRSTGDDTITESDIWADLDAIFILPPRLPGDIDVTQLQMRYGLSQNGAYNRMEQLKRSGKWEIIEVADGDSISGRRKVIRKVAK